MNQHKNQGSSGSSKQGGLDSVPNPALRNTEATAEQLGPDNKDPHAGKSEAELRAEGLGGPGVPGRLAHPKTTVVLELRVPTAYTLPFSITLLPGENDVDGEAWRKLVEGYVDAEGKERPANPGVKMYVDLGHIVVKSGADRARPITDRLSTISPSQARMWIDKEENESQLLTWAQNETRKEVADAINARIESMRHRKDGLTKPSSLMQSEDK